MKKVTQIPELTLKLEKDDEQNKTKMQLRVWFLDNLTTVVVRLFKHANDAHKVLWEGRNNGQVNDLMIGYLQDWDVITNQNNWEYSSDIAVTIREQDEFEESYDCIYFAWKVKEKLLNF